PLSDKTITKYPLYTLKNYQNQSHDIIVMEDSNTLKKISRTACAYLCFGCHQCDGFWSNITSIGVVPSFELRYPTVGGGSVHVMQNGAPQSIQRTAEVGFVNKQHQGQLQFQARMVAQPRKKGTLDSLFANMKEQRMRMQSHQINTAGRRGGFARRSPQQQQRSGRGRNYYTN
ncbi:hypothetical protein MKX03_026587, partial [Papaver bracteatum]